jgi:hypothetical protein
MNASTPTISISKYPPQSPPRQSLSGRGSLSLNSLNRSYPPSTPVLGTMGRIHTSQERLPSIQDILPDHVSTTLSYPRNPPQTLLPLPINDAASNFSRTIPILPLPAPSSASASFMSAFPPVDPFTQFVMGHPFTANQPLHQPPSRDKKWKVTAVVEIFVTGPPRFVIKVEEDSRSKRLGKVSRQSCHHLAPDSLAVFLAKFDNNNCPVLELKGNEGNILKQAMLDSQHCRDKFAEYAAKQAAYLAANPSTGDRRKLTKAQGRIVNPKGQGRGCFPVG